MNYTFKMKSKFSGNLKIQSHSDLPELIQIQVKKTL